MDHFIQLANEMEELGLHKHVDVIMKTALDLTQVINEDALSAAGGYGRFYSKFSPENKHTMKNQLGQIPHDVGIKHFYDQGNSLVDISENLAFVYLAPYIKANTDLTVPVNKGIVSLSGMIANKMIVTQKMPGSPINDLLRSVGINKYDQNHIGLDTERAIRNKLKDIGITWNDIHVGNYFVHPETADEFLMYFNQNKSTIFNEEYDEIDFYVFDFDFSKKACIFDFGGFYTSSSTPPGQQLLNLKKKIDAQPKNGVLGVVSRAILNMVD